MSGINYSKLRSLTARELINALLKDGFYLHRQSGSHRHYKHQDGRRVTISFHNSRETFSIKILEIIIEDQAKWTENDLKRLNILK